MMVIFCRCCVQYPCVVLHRCLRCSLWFFPVVNFCALVVTPPCALKFSKVSAYLYPHSSQAWEVPIRHLNDGFVKLPLFERGGRLFGMGWHAFLVKKLRPNSSREKIILSEIERYKYIITTLWRRQKLFLREGWLRRATNLWRRST